MYGQDLNIYFHKTHLNQISLLYINKWYQAFANISQCQTPVYRHIQKQACVFIMLSDYLNRTLLVT